MAYTPRELETLPRPVLPEIDLQEHSSSETFSIDDRQPLLIESDQAGNGP
jgi:hypothetical protein